MNQQKKVFVVGVGPGNERYLTLEAYQIIQKSDLIFASQRVSEASYVKEKNVFIYDGKFEEMFENINSNRDTNEIAILVSGDTGYYSLANMIKKRLENINIVPGISSFQYLFSKLQRPWQGMKLGSLHGRESDIIEMIKTYKSLVLLTDKTNNAQEISKKLVNAGFNLAKITVGENLSYENEKITIGTAEEMANIEFESLAVVVIEYEN